MKCMEQAVGRVAVVYVVVLLLGFVGCTTALDRRGVGARDEESKLASTEPAMLTSEQGSPPEPSLTADETAAASRVTEEEPVEPTLRIYEIRVAERDGRQALVIELSRPPDAVNDFALSAPPRFVVDLTGPLAADTAHRTYRADAGSLARVRVAPFQGKLRLVADLESPVVGANVEQHGRWVTVLLGSAAAGAEHVVYMAPDRPAAITRGADTVQPTEPAIAETVARDEPAIVEADIARESTAPPLDGSTAATAVDSPPEDVADARMVEEGSSPAIAADEEAQAYVMPVRAKPAGSSGRKAKPVTTSVNGGTIESLPPRTPREYTGQRISLDFKDADIQNVLRILADVSGLNMVTTEEVGGKLTMRLVEVPWDQALDAILQAKGLDMVREGNIVRISTVTRLKEERDAQRAADEAGKQVEPLQLRYIKVNYAKADEKLIKKLEEKVLTERGSATWDERTNTVMVRDIGQGIADAETFLHAFDTQTPQIQIEANIVEATDDFIRDLGIQWGYTYQAGPEVGNATGYNFPGRVGAGGALAGPDYSPAGKVPFIADFPAAVFPGAGSAYDLFLGSLDGSKSLSARLTALEREGKGKIISRPRVVTLNNVPAKIESLRIVRVKLPSTGTVINTGQGGQAGGGQVATEEIRTGITLEVTPQLSSDGFVFLDVFAKSSQLAESTSPDGIPDEISREAGSHVLIRDGETFVLGGVFRETLKRSDKGVPYLSNLPVLGWAFKNSLKDDKREELLVFVTPRSVATRNPEALASLPSAQALWEGRGHP